MATNIINELDSQLASLNQLKPPGASKGKIASITQLCVNNIQVSIDYTRRSNTRDVPENMHSKMTTLTYYAPVG